MSTFSTFSASAACERLPSRVSNSTGLLSSVCGSKGAEAVSPLASRPPARGCRALSAPLRAASPQAPAAFLRPSSPSRTKLPPQAIVSACTRKWKTRWAGRGPLAPTCSEILSNPRDSSSIPKYPRPLFCSSPRRSACPPLPTVRTPYSGADRGLIPPGFAGASRPPGLAIVLVLPSFTFLACRIPALPDIFSNLFFLR
eukprot:609140-Rhodomonas_salina.2